MNSINLLLENLKKIKDNTWGVDLAVIQSLSRKK